MCHYRGSEGIATLGWQKFLKNFKDQSRTCPTSISWGPYVAWKCQLTFESFIFDLFVWSSCFTSTSWTLKSLGLVLKIESFNCYSYYCNFNWFFFTTSTSDVLCWLDLFINMSKQLWFLDMSMYDGCILNILFRHW
jgi:hypothetical protein